MDNNIPGRKRQTSPLRALRPHEQASMLAIAHIEKTLETPDNIENCEEWIDIVVSMGKAAQDGPIALEKEKIKLFKAVPEFAAAYALYTPVPAAPPDQEEDRRIKTSETGIKTFRYLKSSDLKDIKRARWAITGILKERSVNLIYGDAGVGKTFITLDMALHLAMGIDWKGRAVRSPMKVLYIYSEGDSGLRDREDAWKQHYGYNCSDLDGKIFYIPFPVQVEQEARELFDTIEEIGNVGLVVIDTFSMCSSGVDESNNPAVAKWLQVSTQIKTNYECIVIIVHHVGKNGQYRGASSFRGNVDSMMCASIGEDGQTITFGGDKAHRDSAAFEPFYLERRVIDLGLDEETLEMITSCVVVSVDHDAIIKEKITSEQITLMRIISAHSATGITDNKLKSAALENKISKQKCDSRVTYMEREGLVRIDKKGQSHLAYLTEKGQNVLSAAALDGEVDL